MMTLRSRTVGAAAALAVMLTALPSGTAAPAGAARVGRWSRPVEVGVIGIHAVLVPTGEVLLYGHREDDRGSEAHLINPITGDNVDVSLAYRRNVFCSGHSLMPDGRVLVTGGQRYDDPRDSGVRNTTVFDPFTRTWTEVARMFRPRWYPSNVQMPDGTTLVLSGLGADGVSLVRSMERYDPRSGQYTLLPPSANSDSEPYPRMFLLPDGTVFRAGPNQEGMLFQPATNRWSFVDDMRGGWRVAGAAVLLSDGGRPRRVLTSGGEGPKASAEIIDLAAPSPQWIRTEPMRYARYNHNLVLLADGSVLAVGGGQGPGHYANPVRIAELYDASAGRWEEMAAQAAARTYHSTAILLPDGRVVSAGDDGGDLPRTIEYYGPPYLFRGARPAIQSAPDAITHGGDFIVKTPDAADITRVALVRLGSNTHATDFEQRYLDLQFTRGWEELLVTGPLSPRVAPPGYYMLFILNTAGVPAVARILRVGEAMR